MPMLALAGLAQGWRGCPWCGQHMWQGGGLMMLVWLVVLIVVIWVIVSIARRGAPPSGPSTGAGSAEQILRERYARGEIDEATYRRMLDELRR